ncbi:LysR substrate-binding domain-containing protein [Collimonas sp.]|jgi:DNA-binding transcriptional LysR family regulator|uniref:LysR substrate-binding domain-containing protein n=1 Tax=Collimonas sp. TaxID=1963772 RepID=UPI002C043152|nr:LysR substrate-binding domain-containing protein [Collimonas sp.]HWW07151.1 LysR substrate-binding domain-containing protein [Collimonas sp.]
MELRHLRYFVAVAEELHFGKAAERLHIVQPALSMQIQLLEKMVGAQLFKRTSRRTELTEVGKQFLPEARRALSQIDRAQRIVERAGRGETGSVAIGFASNAAFVGILSEVIRVFRQTRSDVEIVLRELSPRVQAEEILQGTLDVGLGAPFSRSFSNDLSVTVIRRSPWMLAMSSDHSLANQKKIKFESLSGEPFILYSESASDDEQLAVLRRLIGTEPKVSYRLTNNTSIMTMAAAGAGLALVPSSLSQIVFGGLVYRPVERTSEQAELAMFCRRKEETPTVLAFMDSVLRVSNQNAILPSR